MDALLGAVLLVAGLALVLWGAERLTDGCLAVSRSLTVSPFVVGAIVSGFEPENLVTGVAANLGGLPQVALGTVIGSAIFMLTGALGVVLLLAPMEVRGTTGGPLAMALAIAAFSVALGTGGAVGRLEGLALMAVAVALMAWLYRCSPARAAVAAEGIAADAGHWPRVGLLLVVGLVALAGGAELAVRGATTLLAATRLSETFLGMVVVAVGESLEETARMLAPARRGHPELAWGNVVGTLVVLAAFNLGVIALVRPIAAEPIVLRLHAPWLVGATLVVAAALAWAPRLGRRAGAALVGLYAAYLALNLFHAVR